MRTKTPKKKAKKKVAKKKPKKKVKKKKRPVVAKKKPTKKKRPAGGKPKRKKQLPAAIPKGYLNEIGDYEEGSIPLPSGGGLPWIGFYNKKASRAHEVKKALGALTMGTPYLCKDDTYYLLTGASFVIMKEFRYWATIDENNAIIDATLEELAFGAMLKGNKSKDCVQVVLLLLPGSAALPADLRPACLTLCDFRGVKAPGVLYHLKEVEKSKQPKWAKQHGDIAGRAPARFRVTSQFDMVAKQSRGGFAYALASATSSVISLRQLEALEKFYSREDNRTLLAEYKENLGRRQDSIQAIADGIEPEEAEEEADDEELEAEDGEEDLDDDGGFDEEGEEDADEDDDDAEYEDDDEDYD